MNDTYYFSQINKDKDNGYVILKNLDQLLFTSNNKIKYLNLVNNNEEIYIKDIKNLSDKTLYIKFILLINNTNNTNNSYDLISIDNNIIFKYTGIKQFDFLENKITLVNNYDNNNLYNITIKLNYNSNISQILGSLNINGENFDNNIQNNINLNNPIFNIILGNSDKYSIGGIKINVLNNTNNTFFDILKNTFDNLISIIAPTTQTPTTTTQTPTPTTQTPTTTTQTPTSTTLAPTPTTQTPTTQTPTTTPTTQTPTTTTQEEETTQANKNIEKIVIEIGTPESYINYKDTYLSNYNNINKKNYFNNKYLSTSALLFKMNKK
jgi:hypothetical protein